MTQKALIYCRVSSKRQATDGSGLTSQEKRCRLHASQKGYEIDGVFPDDITGGGDFMKRPGMVAMLGYLKAMEGTQYVIIFDDLKRLARDTKYYLFLKDELAELNATIECLNFNFDPTPEGKFYETIVAAGGELEREQNARQVRQKSIARMEAGYWALNAPLGYKMQTERGKPRILVRDEPNASYIQEVLEGFANGRFETLIESKRFLDTCNEFPKTKSKGVHTDVVKKLLTRSVYAGMVELEQWGVSIRKGHHDGIINMQTFQKIQERLTRKAKTPQRKDLNADFVLRGTVDCAECNGAYTANWSKGRKTSYPYYICRNKGCGSYGKSIRRHDMESQFSEKLREMVVPKPIINTANRMFKLHWDDIDKRREEDSLHAEEQLIDLETESERLIDKIVSSKIPSVTSDLENRMQSIELEKIALQEKISNFSCQTGDFDENFRTALNFLENPYKLWASEKIEHKRAVIKLSFSERLVYDRNDGFRTACKSSPFRLLGALTKGETKMVGRAGFEPATN
ncbi:recombinase family protein [Paraglaciecola sp.]|uniref:recombinase family protein n=1 Tax=Paraglaciecola sp. TaxID=1920173 RepID=UPI00387E672E